MAHLSLYRKYRPQSFSEVVGQQHVTRTLQTAIKQDRLAHALLFSGPRGTGKTSTARILAKALNCEQGTDESCGECPSCLQIAGGSSLDVVEIDAASHGSVDDARDLREKVAYSSVGGRWKVYIIDECHMLSTAANNALLKVLEEPPPHVIFVFATTEPHKVLQTVLDRCQRYEFRSVGALDTAGRLVQICEAEGITADAETLTLISSRAGGSVRDALSMLDQLRAFAGDTIEVGDLAQLLGRMPDEVLFEAVDLISERDIGAVFVFAEHLIRSGVDIREFARALTDHLRSLFLVLHAPAAREILEVTDDGLTRLQEQANHLGSTEVLRLIDLTNEIGLQLRQAVESRLALEVGLARMTRPDLHATPASLLARLDRLERNQGLEPLIAPAQAPATGKPLAAPAPGAATPTPRPPARPQSGRTAPSWRDSVAGKDATQRQAPAPAPPTGGRPASATPPASGSPTTPAASGPPAPASGQPAPPTPAPTPASGRPISPAAASAPLAPPSAPPSDEPTRETRAPAASGQPAPPAAAPTPASGQPTPAPSAPASVPTAPASGAQAAPPDAGGVPAEAVPSGEVDLETIIRAWPLVKDKVKRRKISFHAVLLPAKPVAWHNGELVLEFGPRSRFHRDKVADKAQNGPLLEAFAEVLGVTPRVKCVLGGDEPPSGRPGTGPEGPPPDEGYEPDSDGSEPAEDAVELIRRAFKGTVVVDDP